MYRIAQQPLSPCLTEQPCNSRPQVKLQSSRSQFNITLPDRLLCRYPAADGGFAVHEIAVHTLGDNAHGICFLIGVGLPQAFPIAFRIDSIAGLVTRLDSGESLTIHMWEHRVRQKFSADRDIDALPLSSILITDDKRAATRIFADSAEPAGPMASEPSEAVATKFA